VQADGPGAVGAGHIAGGPASSTDGGGSGDTRVRKRARGGRERARAWERERARSVLFIEREGERTSGERNGWPRPLMAAATTSTLIAAVTSLMEIVSGGGRGEGARFRSEEGERAADGPTRRSGLCGGARPRRARLGGGAAREKKLRGRGRAHA
jgi:hypothetical protein